MIQRDPLQELNRALSLTPTPEFTVRVRRRIASEPVRRPSWSLVALATSAALVVAVSTAVVQWTPQSSPGVVPDPSIVMSPSPEREQTTVPAIASPNVGQTQPRRRGDLRRAAVDHAALTDATPPFAETLVPDDQRVALERLIASLRAGRFAVPELVIDDVVDDEGHRMPRALVIEPMRIPRINGTPAEPTKEPIK